MTWLDTLLDEPIVCITDMLRRFAKERGEDPALICGREVVTYAALDARVDRFAAALQRDCIQPRDAIALCAVASVTSSGRQAEAKTGGFFNLAL
jgi:acyl-CoA synthetase (AMP-forming)/AMP-acid ligase II